MLVNDRKMDIAIGVLLRAGVILAVAVVLGGGIGYLASHGTSIPDYHEFSGAPADMRSIAGIVGGALHGSSRSIIQLGLLLLIATPIARVAFSAAAFAVERDRLYVFITLIVLAVLLGSLLGLSVAPG
jgi:uncharacterized membrane protein